MIWVWPEKILKYNNVWRDLEKNDSSIENEWIPFDGENENGEPAKNNADNFIIVEFIYFSFQKVLLKLFVIEVWALTSSLTFWI